MRWVYTLTLRTLPACTLTRAPLIPQCQAAATPPTAFYAPWTSSPCALLAPKGRATCWGGPPGCLWPGRVGEWPQEPCLPVRPAQPRLGWSCPAGPGWQPTWWVGRGPQRAAPPERHWMGFLVASAKQACYPLPWSRVREVQPVGCHKHSAGNHERGWPPAGDLRAGARGSQAGAWSCVAPHYTDACFPLRRESCVFRGLPDQCVTPRRVSSPYVHICPDLTLGSRQSWTSLAGCPKISLAGGGADTGGISGRRRETYPGGSFL